jgi:hypothetical protein
MELNSYRFLSDEEPTDEQLEQLMKEVGEEARAQNEKANRKFKEYVQLQIKLVRESELAKAEK